ncbi:MAG TPA: sigma-70 family RNA polymerase sigma factor [Actinomycetota bacterium]|nr:sigma-70 family RNA polymerase sigma factor [Actinomycetota bacterium]
MTTTQGVSGGSGESFEAVWPELQRRIQRFLSSKNVPDSHRDDVVQETGLRLYRMWDQVDPANSPVGLALTIAMNIVRDNARRDSHRTVVEIEPEIPALCDVERSGLARLELSRVRRALGELTPAQRSVLLSELDRNQVPPEASAAAIKMLRMRARRNLSAILERAGCGVLVARWRRLLGLPQEMLVGRDLTKVEQGLASSLAGVVAAAAITLSPLSLFGFDNPGGTVRTPAPSVAAPATVWLSQSEIELASASPTDAGVAAPRAANLDGESALVRTAAASGTRRASAGGKGKAADEGSAVVDVPLPNGEGEIEGDGGVDVDIEPPTIDPGDDNPLCDPTAPGCAPSPGDRPGSAHASAKVRVRNVTVSVTVDTENVADAVEVTDL